MPVIFSGDFAIDDVALYRVPCSQVTNLVFVSTPSKFFFLKETGHMNGADNTG